MNWIIFKLCSLINILGKRKIAFICEEIEIGFCNTSRNQLFHTVIVIIATKHYMLTIQLFQKFPFYSKSFLQIEFQGPSSDLSSAPLSRTPRLSDHTLKRKNNSLRSPLAAI